MIYKKIKYMLDNALEDVADKGELTSSNLEIIEKLNIDRNIKASELTSEQIGQINSLLQNEMLVEGDLRRVVAADIRRLQQINCYRGTRHRRNLPCHGQRTKTNARTRKGKKVTIGAIRDKTQRRLAKA